MKLLRTFLILVTFGSMAFAQHDMMTGQEVWEKLLDGNARFAKNKMMHPHETPEYRTTLSTGQHPHAVILSCSDSRVPPEIVFDEGLGDLFIIRVAGNIVSDDVLGSIEYGAEHLHIPLLVVMGHESCGAVTAASKGYEEDDHIKILLKEIEPAVEKAREKKGNLVENAIAENVKYVVDKLKHSGPVLSKLYEEGKLKIIGARYDLDTGLVEEVK